MKIIIIGAGIGGLTTAIALSSHNIQIYEQRTNFQPLGTGIGIGSNALSALDSIGLASKIKQYSHTLHTQQFLDLDGKVLNSIDFSLLQQMYGQENVTIHRGELHQLLFDSNKNPITFNKRCISIEQIGTQAKVIFADGTSDIGDLVIAADGIHSTIRKQYYPQIQPRFAGYTAWRGIAKMQPHMKNHVSAEYLGPGKRFGFAPLSNNRFYWFACINASEKDEQLQGLTKQELASLFTEFSTNVHDLIMNTNEEQILHHDIYDIKPPSSYVKGRVIFLGDAAHATTPNMGQGACQAIEDAIHLANLLNSFSLTEALKQYDKDRAPHTKKVVSVSNQLGKVMQIQNPILYRSRNFITKFIPSSLFLWRIQFLYKNKN